ncbi:hypothetical protein [Kitasatospora sp. NPDC058478]|uniref:hypothetical protein n=1 Tax=unclassified Kitasatospora TaxID=2633591 RepID=UPI00366864C1
MNPSPPSRPRTTRPGSRGGPAALGWATTPTAAVQAAVALERYCVDAASLGLADRADTLLTEAQGEAAGRLLCAESQNEDRGE